MKLKKLTALLLALVLAAGVTGISAIAAEDGKTVSLRIEGLDECLFYGEKLSAGDKIVTAADLLEHVGGREDAPDITIVDGEYGAYISEIDGLSEMSYGEMSGWSFLVNGESLSLGIGDYDIEDGDDIVVFFGDPFGAGMQYPVIDTSRLLTDGIIKFTSVDTVYDEEWVATQVTNPIAGATVEYDKASMITDENGEIVVPQYNMLAGLHFMQIERYDEESGVPTVLRYPPEYKIFVPFTDMTPGAWYSDAVEFCVREGHLAGMGDNTFAPDSAMSMSQLVTVLNRIVKDPLTSSSNELWYTAAMNWAAESGIMPDDDYSPDEGITREVFIYMFYKTAELDGGIDMHQKAVIVGAEDYDEISEEYIGAVEWAVATGLIIGVEAGHNEGLIIDPQGLVSRAVVCQMLARFYS